LTGDAREVVTEHVQTLVGQIAAMLRSGVERGEFNDIDPDPIARAVFDATSRFHNPAYAAQWVEPGIDAAFEAVWALILNGLGV
jgi:hypothetical protein